MTHSTRPPNARTAGVRSPNVLLNILILVLMPLFLAGADGDLALARAAARETIVGFGTRHHMSLVLAARTIAFSLSALDLLGPSMRDDLAIPLILRLRANANALNRMAERAERMVAEAPCAAAEAQRPIDENANSRPCRREAQARAAAARASMQAAEAASPSQPASNTRPAQPVPQPTQASITAPAQSASPLPQASMGSPVQPALAPMVAPAQQTDALWGAAMADVAAEFAAEAAQLPPAERRVASLRAQILSTAANNLLCGASVPRPHSGDLAALMQPPRR